MLGTRKRQVGAGAGPVEVQTMINNENHGKPNCTKLSNSILKGNVH